MKKDFDAERKKKLTAGQREELLAGLAKAIDQGYGYSVGTKLREYAAAESDPKILKQVVTKALDTMIGKDKEELPSFFSAIFEYSAQGANILAAEKLFEQVPSMIKKYGFEDTLKNFQRIAHWDKALGDYTIKEFDTVLAKIDDPVQQARFASALIDRGRMLGPLPDNADALTLHVVESGLRAVAKIKDFDERTSYIGFIGLRHAQNEDPMLLTARHMMLEELEKAKTPKDIAKILRASTGYVNPDTEIDAAVEEKWKAAVGKLTDKDAKFQAAIDVAEVMGSHRGGRVEYGKTLETAVGVILDLGAQYLKDGELPKDVKRALEGIANEGHDQKGKATKLLKQAPPPEKAKLSVNAFLGK